VNSYIKPDNQYVIQECRERRRKMPSRALIGEGCTGLAVVHEILDVGVAVMIFEQNHGVRGRVATRKKQGFTYDYGAQYIKRSSQISTVLITERFKLADLIDIAKPV